MSFHIRQWYPKLRIPLVRSSGMLFQATRRFANLRTLVTGEGTIGGRGHGRVERQVAWRANGPLLMCMVHPPDSSRAQYTFLLPALHNAFLTFTALRSERFRQVLEDSVRYRTRAWAVSGMWTCRLLSTVGHINQYVSSTDSSLIHLSILSFSLVCLSFYSTRTPSDSFSLPAITMVRQTRPKNKAAHPTAPVMSNTAKVKAGIIPAKPQAK